MNAEHSIALDADRTGSAANAHPAAHEVTVERRLWLAEREHECRSNQHSSQGFRLETVK
jgi:O-succinylbenzoate synthase